MSSALLVALFAILGAGLAITSAACVVLWRRVHALAPASGDEAASPTARKQGWQVRHTTRHDPHPGPLPGGEGGRRKVSGTGEVDLARRFEDLAGKHRALEARVARLEASAASISASDAIVSHPVGPRPVRRVDLGGSATSAGPTLISVPDLAAPPAPNSEAAAELDRRFGPVWAMADEGAPVDAIARETGYPIGQVELILGLRRRLLVAEAGLDA